MPPSSRPRRHSQLHALLLFACLSKSAPTQLETRHFSITTEGYTIIFWIRWREVAEDDEVNTRQEQVEMARMTKLDDLPDLRVMLHNQGDFTLGKSRLRR